MIEERIGDIFEQEDINVICHQVNCFHIMGAGIAGKIASKYPEALIQDKQTRRGDMNKLGTYSMAQGRDGKFIANVYGQYRYGRSERHTNYEALYRALESLEKDLSSESLNWTLGAPYKMGCNLGGGDWRIVKAIMESVFEHSPLKLFVMKFSD